MGLVFTRFWTKRFLYFSASEEKTLTPKSHKTIPPYTTAFETKSDDIRQQEHDVPYFRFVLILIFLPVVCSEALHGGSETSCEDRLVELGVCQPWPEQAHVPTFPFVLLVQVKTINSEDCHLVLRSTSLKEKILHLSQSTNQTIYWLLLKDSVAARKAKG